jgi:hypothetical protein
MMTLKEAPEDHSEQHTQKDDHSLHLGADVVIDSLHHHHLSDLKLALEKPENLN